MKSSKVAILCVDDEKIILDSLKHELYSHFGNAFYYEVAESGEEALEILEELIEAGYTVPLVISDCIMKPGMPGDELLNTIRQRYNDIMCVMLTGQTHPQFWQEQHRQVAVDQLVAKPWEATELMEIVRVATQKV